MSSHRVSLQFDLENLDEEKARTTAAEILRILTRRVEEAGGRAETAGESPEVTVHGLLKGPDAAAGVIASELLTNAAAHVSWVEVHNSEVCSKPA
jgi:hypothetical protein